MQERYYDYMLRRYREDRMENTINNSQKSIWVTFRKEGIHKYPAALDSNFLPKTLNPKCYY